MKSCSCCSWSSLFVASFHTFLLFLPPFLHMAGIADEYLKIAPTYTDPCSFFLLSWFVKGDRVTWLNSYKVTRTCKMLHYDSFSTQIVGMVILDSTQVEPHETLPNIDVAEPNLIATWLCETNVYYLILVWLESCSVEAFSNKNGKSNWGSKRFGVQ